VPDNCEPLIIDTPAALESHDLPEITRGADAILVPVMPSDIDIHAAAKCIADLLLVAKIRRADERLGIVANRVRSNTLVSHTLMRFLGSLDIPLIATLRDSQNYVRCSESGLGLYELPKWQVRQDIDAWDNLMRWLGANQPTLHDERAGVVMHDAL
jgi:chromosome partitioning protein